MEIQTNTNVPQVWTAELARGHKPSNSCHTVPSGGAGGSNVAYRARSANVSNPKDAYGFRPMSPFEGVEWELVQPTGTSHVWRANPTNQCFDGLFYKHQGSIPKGIEYWFRGQVERNNVAGGQTHDLLAMRAEANLKQQDINILQFAAFLPATLKNIASNLKKMDEMLNSLNDLQRLKRLLKREDPRSLYLQWLFVWNQLYRDVVGGALYLKSKARPIGSLVTGRASNTAENEEVVSKEPYSNYKFGRAICTTRMSLSQRAVSIARISCDMDYTSNRLGFTNPAYLAWDLVKWSWVIDQIADLGLFISSITSMHGLEFLGTSITDRVVNETTVTVESYSERDYRYECDFRPGFSRRKSVKRVIRESPTQTITIRNPFQNNVMITAAVAAALSMKSYEMTGTLRRLARQAR